MFLRLEDDRHADPIDRCQPVRTDETGCPRHHGDSQTRQRPTSRLRILDADGGYHRMHGPKSSRHRQAGSTDARELLASRARDRTQETAERAWYPSAWPAWPSSRRRANHVEKRSLSLHIEHGTEGENPTQPRASRNRLCAVVVPCPAGPPRRGAHAGRTAGVRSRRSASPGSPDQSSPGGRPEPGDGINEIA